MSLKTFHIVFVTVSTLVAFAFGAWCLFFHRELGGVSYLVLGFSSFVGGAGLIAYGFWFWSKIRTREEEDRRRRKLFRSVPVAAAMWLLGTRAVHACSVCYGEAEGPMIDAARLGVWLLFGLVVAMQVSFVIFFVCLYRRAKRYREEHHA